MRLLAIDFGQKRAGLAVCDYDETITSPLAVVDQAHLIKKALDYIENEDIGAVVVGLPLNMDGSEGRLAKAVRRFAEDLKKRIKLAVYFQDERLTSFDAEQKLAGSGLTRGKKKKRLDAVAAANILQAFLDSKAGR